MPSTYDFECFTSEESNDIDDYSLTIDFTMKKSHKRSVYEMLNSSLEGIFLAMSFHNRVYE